LQINTNDLQALKYTFECEINKKHNVTNYQFEGGGIITETGKLFNFDFYNTSNDIPCIYAVEPSLDMLTCLFADTSLPNQSKAMFLEVIYNDQTIDKNFESMALL
jgi:hypothetical protein